MGFRETLSCDLESLKLKNQWRELLATDSRDGRFLRSGRKRYLDFSSNDYLGLGTHPEIKKAVLQAVTVWGSGSGASRLISGDLRIHGQLEEKLARFKSEEKALVFSSGYLANLGALTAVLDERDLVLADRFCHASLIDAARLSRAKLWVYPHADVQSVKKLLSKAKKFRRRLVMTDAYFSMDGDLAPLPDLLDACENTDSILMIDEAHSTGVFGASGRGLTEHWGLQGRIPIVMGTLSKALGSVGGYIAGSDPLHQTLINRAKSFIYTTAPSPAASAAALAAIEWIQRNPVRIRLFQNRISAFRKRLLDDGFDLMGSTGPILPLRIGDSLGVIRWRDALKKEGVWAGAVRPPTVPKNTDRIRLSLKATHTDEDWEGLLRALQKIRKNGP